LTDLASLATAVRATRRDLDRQAGRAQQVARAWERAEADIGRLTDRVELCASTAALLTRIGEEAQESAREMFDDLATRALQDIFGDEFSFRLVPGEAGGQVTLEPVIRSEHDGEVIETPVLEARGGGMAVVVGFVLQLVMVLLTPSARKILFLDETFAFVSESYTDRLAEFIAKVARTKGVQVVMITHDRTFAQYADVKVRLVLGPDGVTRVFEGESELWRASLRRTRVAAHFVSAAMPNITTRRAADGAPTGSGGTTRPRGPLLS
jgi:DNA repair exonuclease SbcCD ATPase subunit